MIFASGIQAAAGPRDELDPELWLERHGDVLYRYALVRLRSTDAAENAVQETLLAALEARASYGGRASERTWLIGILKHKIIDSYRKSARELPNEDLDASSAADDDVTRFDQRGRWQAQRAPQPWGDPHAAVQNAQLYRTLEDCLELLTPQLARAFALREMDELDTPDICKILGVTATNLGVMLHRARQRLRGCLEQRWFSADRET